MKHTITYFSLIILWLTAGSYNLKAENKNNLMGNGAAEGLDFKSGYSDVNGLKMYYEIYGEGEPLVLIHG